MIGLGHYTLPMRDGATPVAPTTLAGLVDAGGSWVWAIPGTYGLSDDGAGGWVWSATPQYRLDPTTMTWVAV